MNTLQEILSEDPIRVAFAVFATGVFFGHIVLLTRLSGKRSLAEMTTFDFVTNVSVGSILPAAIVTRGIAFWTGIAVLTTLVVLQYATTLLASRSRRFESWVTNPPRVLYYRGSYVDANLRKERVSRQQVQSKLREQGYASLEPIDAIVLETSGHLAVLKSNDGKIQLLPDVSPRSRDRQPDS